MEALLFLEVIFLNALIMQVLPVFEASLWGLHCSKRFMENTKSHCSFSFHQSL